MADDDLERVRELQGRLEKLRRENEASPPRPAPEPQAASPVQPAGRRRGRLRSIAGLLALVLGIIVVLQIAATVATYNGNDFNDARRVGQAKVESCDRRGPVGAVLGYWYECVLSITWNDGNVERGTVGGPRLVHADDVGKSIQIGDNGTSRNGREYSRPTLPPRPALGVLGVVLGLIAGIPALILLWSLWMLVRDSIARIFRRR
ncbi:hypothetical protein EV385_0196 [Krasilnikovia cinnamomea]|uniref:Uncharacterized protein n=1 Tax=Krasilnikovia cinnamomea TaxID=349313 RepID=A0A4Q7ZCV1_9ACTN|nr:DUF6346 domain-containing protein [Krasilnikovia cinnamomea]RZU48480.1 hypothetical protein EV385_0196 [Krasilnikovia cinnamomea]